MIPKLLRSSLVLLFLLSFRATAQEILKVIEKDPDGHYIDKKAKKKNDSLIVVNKNFVNARVADINSTLVISIDHQKLVTALKKNSMLEIPEETIEMISILNRLMRDEKKILADLKAKRVKYDYEKFKADPMVFRDFKASLEPENKRLKDLLEADPRILALVIEINDTSTTIPILESPYAAARILMNELKDDIEIASREKGVGIQMGAWLHQQEGARALHLPGFDTLEEGDYFEVERWNFLPTKDQIADLEELQKLAKENKDGSTDFLKPVLKSFIGRVKELGDSALTAQLSQLEGDVDAIRSSNLPPAQIGELIRNLTKLKKDIDGFQTFIHSSIEFYEKMEKPGTDLSTLFSRIISDTQYFNKTIKDFRKNLKLANETFDALAANIKNNWPDFIRKTKSFDKMVGIINQFLPDELQTWIGIHQVNTAALEFGQEVFKHSLTDTPKSTELDLLYSGVRKPGDKIVVKIGVVDANEKKVNLETKVISLYRINPHLEATVGVIFANPYQSTPVENFQMAPFYNLLIKGLPPFGKNYRRKSVLANSIGDFSWGIHVSAPDFDKDDIPELGVGLVLSGLKDYLQIGLAHNIFVNKSYWFFGLRLPVPSMNYGGNGQKVGVE